MRLFAWLALVFVFIFFTIYFINDDLWNDEIYTLQHFVLVPISITLTDYHVPNNHVFFSLICNAYLKLIGVKSLATLMAKPFILRTINLIFTGLSIYFFIKIAKLIAAKTNANSLIFWILFTYFTALPFYSFQFQLRGYSLLMCLNTAVLYFLLAFIQRQNWLNFMAIITIGALTIFTVPSNLVVLFGGACFVGIELVKTIFRTRKIDYNENKPLLGLFLSIFLSVLVGLGLYGTMIHSVLNNDYVTEKSTLIEAFSTFDCCFQHFMSWRVLLVLAAIIGIFINIQKKQNGQLLLLVACLFFTPFIINILRLQATPPRVFTEILPIYAVLVGFGVSCFLTNLPGKIEKYRKKSISAIVITSLAGLIITFQAARQHVLADLKEDGRTQNLNVNYFQHYYQPYSELEMLKKRNLQLPIVLLEAEPHDIPVFLTIFAMSYTQNIDSLANTHQDFIALTRHYDKFREEITTKYPKIRLEFVENTELHYPKAIICRQY